jgi:hypothetical protein
MEATLCFGLNVCVPQNSYTEILVLGGGALGGYEVWESSLSPSAIWMYSENLAVYDES